MPPQLSFVRTKLFWTAVSSACSFLHFLHVTKRYQALTLFFQALGHFPVTLYITTFTRGLTSALTATIILSLFNSCAVIGQIVLGWLSDRIHCTWVMFMSLCSSAIATYFLWGFANSSVQLYFFAILVGFLVSSVEHPFTVAFVTDMSWIVEWGILCYNKQHWLWSCIAQGRWCWLSNYQCFNWQGFSCCYGSNCLQCYSSNKPWKTNGGRIWSTGFWSYATFLRNKLLYRSSVQHNQSQASAKISLSTTKSSCSTGYFRNFIYCLNLKFWQDWG